ncbi:MAG: prepilin-type N-terminal cleavage/methylation domain-containing protein [Desulfobacteraceae bacterium]|nr:prepilin-type N-terminal cleavage/methylation domain-containing protein [Desulfobacteraceae bacterium]
MNLRNKEVGNRKPKYSVFCQSSIPPGFTLLELMISLTIIGLILVLVFGSLRIGVRAWEKGEKDVEIHQRQRVVLNSIKRQIASVCLREIKIGDNEPFFFKGDRESMEFMSRIPRVPTTQSGMVYVKYVVREEDEGKKRRLMLYEKDVVFIDKEKGVEDQDEADFFELIPGAEDIEFEYLKAPEDEDDDPEWQLSWDPDTDTKVPMAVKIIFKEDINEAPIYLIARIQVEAGEQ